MEFGRVNGWRKALTVVAVVVVVLGAYGVGYAVGRSSGLTRMHRLVGAEAGLAAMSWTEAATRVRLGDGDGAVGHLETRLLGAITNFVRSPADLRADAVEQAIEFAKLYVTQWPEASGGELAALLSGEPEPTERVWLPPMWDGIEEVSRQVASSAGVISDETLTPSGSSSRHADEPSE